MHIDESPLFVSGLDRASGAGRLGARGAALISVTPAEPVLVAGGTALLQARVVLSDLSSEDATARALWSSSAPSVASVSVGPDAPGRVTALGPGIAVVFARVGAKVGWTTVTVL